MNVLSIHPCWITLQPIENKVQRNKAKRILLNTSSLTGSGLLVDFKSLHQSQDPLKSYVISQLGTSNDIFLENQSLNLRNFPHLSRALLAVARLKFLCRILTHLYHTFTISLPESMISRQFFFLIHIYQIKTITTSSPPNHAKLIELRKMQDN